MTVESASFIAELQPALPAPGDPKSQGDNHIRLIKQVLQNTFPNANKPFGGATLIGQNASFSILPAQNGTVFAVATTSAPVTATLPALAGADQGWSCTFVKSTGDVNPIFIINPAAQNMLSGDTIVNKCRRAIFGHTFKALWTGSFWIVDRIVKVPVGTILDCPRGTLPPGYEFANGQVLVAANYPEYVYAMGSGVTSDRRGYVAAGRDDTGTRLTAPFINGNVLGSVGGAQSHIQATNEVGPHGHTASGGGGAAHTHPDGTTRSLSISTTGPFVGPFNIQMLTGEGSSGHNTDSGGGGGGAVTVDASPAAAAMSWLQPTVITNMIVVVE